jgi:hypothetical protein
MLGSPPSGRGGRKRIADEIPPAALALGKDGAYAFTVQKVFGRLAQAPGSGGVVGFHSGSSSGTRSRQRGRWFLYMIMY